MKKVFIGVFTLLPAVMVFIGCTDPNKGPQHTHTWGVTVWDADITWGDWVTDVPATFTAKGSGHQKGTRTGTETCMDDGTTRTVTDNNYTDGEHTKEIPTGQELNVNGTLSPIAQNLPDISHNPTGVDTLGIIAHWNDNSSVIHGGGLPAGNAGFSAEGILEGHSAQAETLRAYFESAESAYPTLADKFGAIKDAEATIKSSGNGKTLEDRGDIVDTQTGIIWDTIFGATGEARENFDKYFTAYTLGQYLANSDWKTRADNTQLTTMENDFKTALEAIGMSLPTGTYEVRGNGIKIGSNGRFIQLNDRTLIPAIRSQIVEALGITQSYNETNANEMAKALIVQLGQDNEEYRAFVDDLIAENENEDANAATGTFSTVLSWSFTIAQANSQPTDIKLASMDATFDPSGIKTRNAGMPGTKFAGAAYV
jgi:hypothetical protein